MNGNTIQQWRISWVATVGAALSKSEDPSAKRSGEELVKIAADMAFHEEWQEWPPHE